MKGIAKIALSVALIVIVVLSIVVASVAWFTSNPEVTASDVTLNAARTLTVSFDTTVSGTDYKYNGQIGNVASGEDAPYVYEAGGFNVTVNSLSSELSRARIKVEFGTVTIHTNVYGMGTVSDVLITDLFSVTANVYKPVESGNENTLFVKDATHGNFRAYNGATDSSLQKYQKAISSLTIADDGVLMDGNSVALFAEGTYALSFTYVFLPDAAYAVWEDACNGEANFTDIYGYELAGDGEYVTLSTAERTRGMRSTLRSSARIPRRFSSTTTARARASTSSCMTSALTLRRVITPTASTGSVTTSHGM